jgi:hypothetical protein
MPYQNRSEIENSIKNITLSAEDQLPINLLLDIRDLLEKVCDYIQFQEQRDAVRFARQQVEQTRLKNTQEQLRKEGEE